MNSKSKKIIVICAIMLVAVIAAAVMITAVVKFIAAKKTKDITPVMPETTWAENETDRSSSEKVQQKAEYDSSVIKSEDIETATAVKVKVDDKRNMTLFLEDGTEVDAGNIGGEKIEGTVTVVFVDYDNRVIKAEMVEKGKSATPPANPVRAGYDFVGWSGNYSNPTKDTVVSAAYVKKDLYYTVTFRDYDGRDIRIEKVVAGGNALGPSAEPVRDGYVFAGWDHSLNDINTDVVITATYVANSEPVIEVSSGAAQPGDKNVSVTVSLKNNPGICAARINTEFDSGLTLTGFEFGNALGGTSVGPQSVPVSGNATFLWYLYDRDMKEDTLFVTLFFDISNDAVGKQNVRISYESDDLVNIDGENVSFGVMNGAVDVSA